MKKATKLKVFDFDGTLVDTPLPEEGKKLYKRKTGEEWPHIGWWGKPESLDMSIFDMPVVKSVIDDYEKVKEDEDAMIIMATGRRTALASLVKQILDIKGLEFDEYHYNTGGATEVVKMRTIERILAKNPKIKDIEIWDDRLEHIPVFAEWGEKLISENKITDFKINVVPADRH